MKISLKLAIAAASIAILSACGGGDVEVIEQQRAFFSVDNLKIGNGTVCIESMSVLDPYSPEGQQVAQDLINFFGTYNYNLVPIHQAYSAQTYCGGPTSNYVPAPGLIITTSYYYDVIVPSVR